MDMERKLSNSTFDIDFIMAGLAYVQHSVSENCLHCYSGRCSQPMRISDRRQCLGVPRLG